MALFKDMLSSSESLFLNEIALDFDYVPKIMPYREKEQRYAASCISPLMQERNGRNLLIHGPPGIGKTAAIRWVIRDLEGETDKVVPIYINCWQKNTTFKIMTEICHFLDYKFTQNKKTEELFDIIKRKLNKSSAVFVFDEIDKAEDFDFLYSIMEEIYRKTILLITNYKEWFLDLDDRIKSRLVPDSLEFRQYDAKETKGILMERVKYAFVPGVWDEEALEAIASRTSEVKDIRSGLYMLKEAGSIAEAESSRKILLKHANAAVEKLDRFTIKNPSDLEEDTRLVLDVVKENTGKKIGDLFNIYKEKGGKNTYKTFQRKIDKLEKNSFIKTNKTSGGAEGNTTIVEYREIAKKITDY